MSKNYLGNCKNGNRRKNDFYSTPYSMTRQLLQAEKIQGKILEPACGIGAIEKILKEAGLDVESYDLHQGDKKPSF